jgi:serine phosphatase RsbU (regulator of sigma subunit)
MSSDDLTNSTFFQIETREKIEDREEEKKRAIKRKGKIEKIATLSSNRSFIEPQNTVEETGKIFLAKQELQALPVVHKNIPIGIVYRQKLMDIFLSPYGRDLHGRKSIIQFMDTNPLMVEYNLPVQVASQYITQNIQLPAVQDFIITKDGEYYGIGTIVDLLEKITSIKINQLKQENMRLAAEVEVTHRLQQMLLPTQQELNKIKELEIAGFMAPADEVGGDYYDVLCHNDQIKIGIGDVTGHGLESGVVMLMVQTAIRTLLTHNETSHVNFLTTLNQVIYDNVERMNCDKNLTLALLDYKDGILYLSGQHEMVIVARADSTVELVDTKDLGFPIGLDEDIADFIAQTAIHLNPGDGVILYTDGITEAQDSQRKQYGLKRLCHIVSDHWHHSASEIQQAIIDDVKAHIGLQKVFDDITVLVLKRK